MLMQRLVGVHEKKGEREAAGVVSHTKTLKKKKKDPSHAGLN